MLYPAELRARFSRGILGLAPGCIRGLVGRSRKSALATRSGPDWQGPAGRYLRGKSTAFWGRHSGAGGSANLGCASAHREISFNYLWIPGSSLRDAPDDEGVTLYARARSLRTLSSSTGRSGIAIRKVAPMVPSTRWMSPPWARTSSAAMASPSPLPPGRPEV